MATDDALIAALSTYQDDIRGLPAYRSYDEILDFTQASGFNVTTEGLKKLAHMAARTDIQGVRTRLAIIVNQPVAYGLGRMYEIYRGLLTDTSKEVRVFRNHRDTAEPV
jgi:hypothetical protein